jgi:putative chitinase
MKNPKAFYDRLRALDLLGPTISQAEFAGCEAIIDGARQAGWGMADLAYGLATAWHETAHTMQPVKEFGGPEYLRRNYDITGRRPIMARQMGNTVPGDGVRYAGRGFVQLTWKVNYARAGAKLGLPLVGNPDLAMELRHAGAIMGWGMAEGWFTGKRLRSYLPAHGPAMLPQFIAARRIINGTDRAADIAAFAVDFQEAVHAGGWE